MKLVIKTDDPIKEYLTKVLESNSIEVSILSFFVNKYNYYINTISLTDDVTIWKLVFHSTERKKCRTELGVTVATFNTCLHNLKKKGCITVSNDGEIAISKLLLYNHKKDNTLTFIFEYNGSKSEENSGDN